MLVPSLYEPCGLTQLYALAYGTIPVVRATGGLADTVVDTSPETVRDGVASGFVFEPFDSVALEQALDRALEAYADRDGWAALVRRVMRQDWSWDHAAREYLSLYRATAAKPARRSSVVDARSGPACR